MPNSPVHKVFMRTLVSFCSCLLSRLDPVKRVSSVSARAFVPSSLSPELWVLPTISIRPPISFMCPSAAPAAAAKPSSSCISMSSKNSSISRQEEVPLRVDGPALTGWLLGYHVLYTRICPEAPADQDQKDTVELAESLNGGRLCVDGLRKEHRPKNIGRHTCLGAQQLLCFRALLTHGEGDTGGGMGGSKTRGKRRGKQKGKTSNKGLVVHQFTAPASLFPLRGLSPPLWRDLGVGQTEGSVSERHRHGSGTLSDSCPDASSHTLIEEGVGTWKETGTGEGRTGKKGAPSGSGSGLSAEGLAQVLSEDLSQRLVEARAWLLTGGAAGNGSATQGQGGEEHGRRWSSPALSAWLTAVGSVQVRMVSLLALRDLAL